MTRHVDELAAHVRRLGNHELNELLLHLPQSSFAALVEVALARPVLPAGLLLRFEPAAGVDGWMVVACAPRRRLGTVTRDRDPRGQLVYRAWTRAGDPVQATGISQWRRRGDAAAALAWATPASPVLRTCGGVGLGLIEPWLSCCAGVAWGLGASRGASTTTPTTPAACPLRPTQRGEAAGGAAGGSQLLPAA